VPAPAPLVHYVVVRDDLPRGLLAAMVVHAAGESSPGNLAAGTHAVVLAAKDEATLRAAAERLTRAGIQHVCIDEPDAPYDGALMAIGVLPARKEVVRKALSSLPLLR
jgi:peptidyl-tRNA hydrolase